MSVYFLILLIIFFPKFCKPWKEFPNGPRLSSRGVALAARTEAFVLSRSISLFLSRNKKKMKKKK